MLIFLICKKKKKKATLPTNGQSPPYKVVAAWVIWKHHRVGSLTRAMVMSVDDF